jgi:valyl-tRNA synthetase
MPDIAPRYNPREVEEKRLKLWDLRKPFQAVAGRSARGAFTVVIPPPNVTGVLHMGHALNNTLQDILVRYKRMNGFDTLWMPGTDHAGIATQNVVEKQLAKEGTSREHLGREKFMERLWEWKEHHGGTIISQLHKLGSSCDWDRIRFTMDQGYSEAVQEVFISLYERGLIYQGKYIINWCPRCQTALSDEEAEHKDTQGNLWHIKYHFKADPSRYVVVATTRPETMLGDTAVAVHPKDERYKDSIGEVLVLPLVNREIKIIADDFVDREFGSGAVKVTPAHDPNDFAMGRRHNLDFINIMYPNGVLNDNAGVFRNMDRFSGRKAVVKALQEQGLLVKVDAHAHSVRYCYRCDTVVEPYLSRQWFVKMKPLADKALEAFKKGQPRIQPKRWEKVYENWLTDIRDWCISRQIWWGHRIPVWYDEKGNHYVAKSEAAALKLAVERLGHAVPLTQDPDVLDTWFSSWLWPFATLGWPGQSRDLTYFYPTTTLFTAPEIIFFWVARMVMAGLEFIGEVPFKDVVLHGTVRDAKGRKMSKSLGNAIDPLEIIAEYGADALRFSMILNSGQDIFISRDKFELGRNFANKLWNASRFVLANVSSKARLSTWQDIEPSKLDLPSRWILARYMTCLKAVSEAVEQYRYSEAENILYDFFWAAYCDWYLETAKGQISDPGVQRVMYLVLEGTLKMLHPFIPFVTEELYSYFRDEERILSLEEWPAVDARLVDPVAERSMDMIMQIVASIRNVRAQWNIKPHDQIECHFVTSKQTSQELLRLNMGLIEKTARIGQSSLSVSLQEVHKNSATDVVDDIKFFIPLGGIIDIEKEKRRISAEIDAQEKAARAIESRLASDAFVSKAPKDVIDKERVRLNDLTQKSSELRKAIECLT